MKIFQKSSLFVFNTFFVSTMLILLTNCSDITTECDPDISGSNNVNLSDFNQLQKNVFTPSCAISGCHAGSPLQANLNLTEGNAYSNLVNVQSLLNPGFLRVDPGDSENSFLIKMLKNSGDGSSLMPPAGGLPGAAIDSIEVWINKGAPNN